LEAGGIQLSELPHLLASSFDDVRSSEFLLIGISVAAANHSCAPTG
jgi:hypothetical protein